MGSFLGSKSMRETHRLLFIIAIATLFVVSAMGQSGTEPARSEAPKSTGAQAQGSAPVYESSEVLKIKTRLVVLDIVARDSKGAPVADLKQDDFTVLEDGKEQKVRIFNFQHAEATPAQTIATPTIRNVIDNLPHFTAGRALNVVLLDSLNTGRVNQVYVREQMIKFLEKLPENEPVAVYLLSDRLHLLQDFTTDQAVLKAVIRSFKGKSSPLLNQSTDGSVLPPILPGIAQSLPPAMAGQIRQFQDQLTVNLADQRVQLTLTALNSLGRTLAGYPGRKNLIWVSEMFPFDAMLSAATQKGGLTARNYSSEVAQTGNLLSDSQIAIYPVDASGMVNSSLYSVNNNTDAYGNSMATATLGSGMRGTMDRESDDRMANRATMNDLADRTGGRAFYNRNDIDGALRDSIDDGATYYTLGYYPENKDWNGEFRKLQVRVKRGGVKLRYRTGYFAMDNAAFAKLNPKKQDEEFDDALSLNFPIATGLPFQGMVMPPSEKTQNKIIVNYGVDPHALSFQATSDGHQQVNVECAVRAFTKKNPDKAVTTEAQKMGGSLPPEAYAKVMKSFFPCRDQLSLAPGEYLLRLGVRDNTTGLIGTVNASVTVPADAGSAAQPPQKSEANKP